MSRTVREEALAYVGDMLPLLVEMCRSAGLEPSPALILGLYGLVEARRRELLSEGFPAAGGEGLVEEDEEAPLRQEIAVHARRVTKEEGVTADLAARVFAEIQQDRPGFVGDVAAVFEGDAADYVGLVVGELYPGAG